MQRIEKKWFYLIGLSIVWGSSFILIKKGLVGLSPLQLGALRTCLAALFVLIIGYKSLKKIPANKWKWIILSASLGTFFPAFLFAFAETEVDSGIVSILNSTVPILALIIGFFVFEVRSTKQQTIGVFIGLIGSTALILSGTEVGESKHLIYAVLPLVATTMYATNVHLIKRHLQEVPALSITTGCFVVLFFPALLVLAYSGFFSKELLVDKTMQTSVFYIMILALIGTSIAKILFNKLVQISTPVFATSVTYLIPVVALMWGLLDGEVFNGWQVISGAVILLGVFLANKKRKYKVNQL